MRNITNLVKWWSVLQLEGANKENKPLAYFQPDLK